MYSIVLLTVVLSCIMLFLEYVSQVFVVVLYCLPLVRTVPSFPMLISAWLYSTVHTFSFHTIISSSGSTLSAAIQKPTLYLKHQRVDLEVTILNCSISTLMNVVGYFLLIFTFCDCHSYPLIISTFHYLQSMPSYRRITCSNLTMTFSTFSQILTNPDLLTIVMPVYSLVTGFFFVVHSKPKTAALFYSMPLSATPLFWIFLPHIITISTFCFNMNCRNFSHLPYNSMFVCYISCDVYANSRIWIS